jgi:hypothetical protein
MQKSRFLQAVQGKNPATQGKYPRVLADGESEPNYWLGYASKPRTDQYVLILASKERAGKTNLSGFDLPR